MQCNRKISEDNRGFSLLELIVTVVILALVTAPFLSSFVTASNTNAKAKKLQEANELGQYVLEECKAMSLDKIESLYTPTKVENLALDSTNSQYNETKSTKYSWTISNSQLPSGYSDKYTADVTVEPIKSIVNSDEAIAQIDYINKKNCAVLRDKIYKNDAAFGTVTHRELDIIITSGTNASGDIEYKVSYKIEYYNWGVPKGSISEEFKYAEFPSVYIMYTPCGVNDKITIDNQVNEPNKKVNIYLMEQGCNLVDLSASNVEFKEVGNTVPDITLQKLIYEEGTAHKLDKTVVHTNIKNGASPIKTDRDNTANFNMKTVKIDTLYNINVVVKYSGKEVTKLESTKLQLNK